MTHLPSFLLAAGFKAGHSAFASAAAGVRTPQKQAAPPASARVPAAKRAAAAGGNQHAKHPRTDAGVQPFQTCISSGRMYVSQYTAGHFPICMAETTLS